ncbi:uncharacterized protein LOC106062654 [Biomphalaria glabrata]|uniref:Uncharacterized protein LOC106062654 n=1 Tax=Biomphalaria glabrata TaxID=6526 RepID=A0A9W3ACR8_BIOGL|nr:uncharacterized protein LOC106062654 [Biomphalaria glabrata]
MYNCLLVCIVVSSAVLDSYQQAAQACEDGWFGPECQYKCRCQQACSPEGECPGQCDVGWFGYKCQYNLVKYTAITRQSQDDLTFALNDNNENTCVAIGNQSIVINLMTNSYSPWIRLHTQDIDLLYALKLTFIDTDNQTAVLTSKEKYIIKDNVVDIHIAIQKFYVRRIILEGEAIQRMCSLWIIKGQNVATKQSVYYSTSDIVGIDTSLPKSLQATDEVNTCNRNDNGVVGATWQLVLKTPFVIKQLDINVNDTVGDFRYFRTKQFDNFNDLYSAYTSPIQPSSNYYGLVFSYTRPTKVFTFSVINSGTNTSLTLLLCEVYAYADCFEGTWGVQCQYPCNKSCSDMCRFDDGLCNDGCFGYSDPPRCSKACESGTWGLNCAKKCSSKCFYSSCDRITGACDIGCHGYSNPPDCTLACGHGTWGINCTKTCSNYCFNSSCDRITGVCDKGCLGYSDHPDCTIACTAGSWGVNCTNKCSDSCVELSCDSKTGFCDRGCNGSDGSSSCNLKFKNSESVSQQTIIASAVSASAVLIAIIICIIVLKVRGALCFRKVSRTPEPTVKPEENFDNAGYIDIDDYRLANGSHIYDKLAKPTFKEFSYG